MTTQPIMHQVTIADLKPGMKHVNLVFKVLEIRKEKNVVSRYDGSRHRVAEIVVGDSTGTIIIPAWNDLIERFETGMQFKVINGYTQLFEHHLR